MSRRLIAALFALAALFCGPQAAQAQRQLPDLDFAAANPSPAFERDAGPSFVISSQNSPFVQRGSFDPLIRLAQGDGFRASRSEMTLGDLLAGEPDIVALINPFLSQYRDYPAMDPPSAFSDTEIEAARQWVEAGGSLLILADHAPLGGGVSKLAAAFGFTFLNGHVAETISADAGYVHVLIDFTPDHGLNGDHPITNGGMGRAPVERFFCFGGQAFIPPGDAVTLLRIPDGWSAIFSYRIQDELKTAPRIDASGMAQGAVLEYGKGRVAVFGEAGAFSAQVIDGTRKFGFNTTDGAQNPEFILSVLRWLAHYTPAD